MLDEERATMGKVTETLAHLRASFRDRRGAAIEDREIQTGVLEEPDHRRDADPTLIAELEALELERSRILSLLMTGEGHVGDQIAALAERTELLRRTLVADSSDAADRSR